MSGACGGVDSLTATDEVVGEPAAVEFARYDFEGNAGVAIDVEGSGAELVAKAEALIPYSPPPSRNRVTVGGEVSGAPEVFRDYLGYDYAIYDITGPLCGIVPTLFVEELEGRLKLRVQHPKTDPNNGGCEAAEFDFVVGIDFVNSIGPGDIAQVRAN